MKILFVCHGNICRSPSAEFILKNMVKREGLEKDFFISSAATSTEEIGNPVYPPMKEELAKHGINCDGKRAVQLKRSDYAEYDLLIGMDSANVRNMHRLLGEDPLGKIKKLMDYTGKGGDVADPWYSGRFNAAYQDIYEGCKCLFDSLKKTV